MSKYKVNSIEERADGDIACDVFVLVEKTVDEVSTDVEIGHFTVILDSADVLALAGETKPNRVAGYKALFFADPRIAGVTDSESAVAQMEADVNFPVTVNL